MNESELENLLQSSKRDLEKSWNNQYKSYRKIEESIEGSTPKLGLRHAFASAFMITVMLFGVFYSIDNYMESSRPEFAFEDYLEIHMVDEDDLFDDEYIFEGEDYQEEDIYI